MMLSSPVSVFENGTMEVKLKVRYHAGAWAYRGSIAIYRLSIFLALAPFTMADVTLLVCTNHRYTVNQPSCGERGGEALLQVLREATEGIDVAVDAACCFGHCTEGAVVRIAPGGKFYHGMTMDDVPKVVQEAKLFAEARAMHTSTPHSTP